MIDGRVATATWALGLALLGVLAACSDDGEAPLGGDAGSSSTNAGAGGMASAASGNGGGSGGESSGAGGGGGGSGGMAGGEPDAPSRAYEFVSGLEGFAVNYVCTATNICGAFTPPPVAPVDTGADATDAGGTDGGSGDGGSGDGDSESAAPPDFVTVSLDSAVGSPDAGSVRLAIQFSGAGQLIDFALNTPTLNLTNKRLTAQVRLEPGGPATTAKMYIKTGMTYVYADSGSVNLTPGAWVQLTYPNPTGMGFVANVVTYNIADVRELGIEIAASPASLTPAIVHVDTVQY